eukprot:961428-Rhodomonas_salina.5
MADNVTQGHADSITIALQQGFTWSASHIASALSHFTRSRLGIYDKASNTQLYIAARLDIDKHITKRVRI